jgi:hypothetical protein
MPKIWLQMVFIAVLLVGCCYWMTTRLLNLTQSPNPIVLIVAAAGVYLNTAIAIGPAFRLLKTLIAYKGLAVWIEGNILYTWMFSVPCEEISSVFRNRMKLGTTFVESEVVIVRLRDGTIKAFPVASLLESREIILDRLNSLLNLKPV